MSQTGGYVYEPRAWWGDEDVQMMTYEVSCDFIEGEIRA